MRKATLIAIALLLPAVSLLASPVKKSAAKATATAFLQKQVSHSNGAKHAPRKLELVSAEADNAPYYVFNNQNGEGFAIVSGDDTVENPILGYSTEGNLSEENMPEALRLCLEDYGTVVRYAQQHGLSMKTTPRKASRPYISSFMNFVWAQSAPYNNECPTYEKDGVTKHMSTGCMAVTTASIVAYYGKKSESQTVSLPAAYNSSAATSSSAHTYDISTFLNSYTTSSELGEMPQFMFHIANILNTGFSESGSGANESNLLPAFRTLGYNNNIRVLRRSGFTSSDWEDIIYAELQAGRPVNFIGEHPDMGGHSFICDGYSNGLYHMLWGWQSQFVGYFDLNILNPFVEAEDSWGYTFPPGGFTSGLKALVGIQPDDIEEDVVNMLITVDNLSKSTTSVTGMFFNYNNTPYTGSFSWAYLNEDGTFEVIDEVAASVTNWTNGNYKQFTLNIANLDLPDGSYKIVPVCKTSAATDWSLCQGASQIYAEVTVANGNLTIITHPAKKLSVESVYFKGLFGNGFMEYIVTIKNEGDDVFGHLDVSGTRSDGQTLAGSQLDIAIPAGQTETFSVALAAGEGSAFGKTYEMTLKYMSEVIWNGVVSTSSSATDKDNIKYVGYNFDDFEAVNTWSNKLYNTVLKGTVQVKATDNHNIPIRVRITDSSSNVVYSKTQQYYVPMGETKDYPIEAEGLESGQTYYITIDAVKVSRVDGTYKTTQLKELKSNIPFTVVSAIIYIDEYGSKHRFAGDGVAELPATTAVVDLTKADVSKINVNSIENPNCLFLLATNTTIPTELEGKNVVVGNLATKITLVDGYPVVFPVDIDAEEMTFTRTFTKGNNGDDTGWETIVLPFYCHEVYVGDINEENRIDWFHSKSENGRKFWLYKYIGGSEGEINFGYEDSKDVTTQDWFLNRDEPYIIAVPGNKWGDYYDLSNKPITFRATHANWASVKANSSLEKKAGFYTLKGTYCNANLADVYVLNSRGDFFEKEESVIVNPFNAYFTGETSTTSKLNISFDAVPTAIIAVDNIQYDNVKIFDLQGRRVQNAQKGIYIQNGKKVVIK